MEANLSNHNIYVQRMQAWFAEQRALIASDRADLANAIRGAEQMREKARLYDQMTEANKRMLEMDELMLSNVESEFFDYLNSLEDGQATTGQSGPESAGGQQSEEN